MSDKKNADLFFMLGSNVEMLKTEDPQEEEQTDHSIHGDLFIDEEIQNPDTQLAPIWIKSFTVVIAIVAIAGLGALVYGLWGMQPEQAPQMMLPITEKELSDEQKEIRQMKKTTHQLKELIAAYLGATSIEQKIKFVRQPARVEPLMIDWYQTKKHTMDTREVDTQMKLVPKFVFGKSFWKAEMADASLGKKELWVQQYDDGSLKVDWGTDVAYNPMPWEEFLKEKPTTATTFRVYIGWDDLYVYEYRDREKFQSFRIRGLHSDYTTIAYMKREDPSAEKMEYLIRMISGRPSNPKELKLLPSMVSVRYDESPEGRKTLVIDQRVSPCWMVFEEKEK